MTIVMLTLLSLTKAQDSFHPDNVELHKIQRSLLQEYDEVSDGGEETNAIPETTTKAPIVYKGIVDHGVPKEGPRLFYDGSKFIMRLGGPIRVHIFNNKGGASDVISVDLDGEADSIKGSKLTEDSYKVNFDWKTQSFGNNLKISSISIHMYFKTTEDGTEFVMNELEVTNLRIDASQMIKVELDTTTKQGYKVAAPIHSSFCCYDPGMFMPKREGNENNEYTVGLTFPYLQLQYDDFDENPEKLIRFGPEWDCDSFVTVEGLVGFFITLLFASICVWGFCMLANIQTMDRFDDPRGKTIHVPASAD